jgi:hypothetical protein
MKSNILSIAWIIVAVFTMPSCKRGNGDKGGGESISQSRDNAASFTIAPRLVRIDGSYELLAVIEGVEPNRQFVENLQIVTVQKGQLKKLMDETEGDGGNSEKIEVLEKKLRENAILMTKTYGYNLTDSYLFIPVESSLMKVAGEKKQLIREFEAPTDYEKLQGMRAEYSALVRKRGEGTSEAVKLAQELMEAYGFDVKLNYALDVQKGALYRKVEK